jgi:hydrogenase maturation protease
MGDEGVGVVAANELAKLRLGDGVEVLDGGTGGFHLLPSFENVDRLVLVDASLDGLPPGTVRSIRPRFLADFPRALSAHEIGLRDLIESATLLGRMPPTDLVTVSVAPPSEVSLELSPAVAAAVPEVVAAVRSLLDREPRDAPASLAARDADGERPGRIPEGA